MTETLKRCHNCEYAQWTGAGLTCTNQVSDEYMLFKIGFDTCNEFERYAGADGDETDSAGAIE